MIDIHEDLRTWLLRDDVTDVNRLEMTTYSFPDHFPVAIDHGDAVGSTDREDQADIFELAAPA